MCNIRKISQYLQINGRKVSLRRIQKVGIAKDSLQLNLISKTINKNQLLRFQFLSFANFTFFLFVVILILFRRGWLDEKCAQFIQSIKRKKTIPNVNGSPLGVMNAAATNNPTMACLLYLWKKERFKMPTCDNNQETKGISKTIPITKISIMKLSMYDSKETCSVMAALNS